MRENNLDSLFQFLEPKNWTLSAREKLRIFDGCVPFYGPFLEMYRELIGGTTWYHMDAEPDATGRLTKASMLGHSTESTQGGPLPLKVAFKTKTQVELTVGQPSQQSGSIRLFVDSGSFVNGQAKMEKRNGHSIRRWLEGRSYSESIKMRDEFRRHSGEFSRIVPATCGVFFLHHFYWMVSFRKGSGISVRFPIDPRIALELFSDRQKSPQKARREALMHWVQEHLRKKPTRDDYSIVRKHIRGKTKFLWHGYHCVIDPDKDYLDSLNRNGEAQ